MKEIEKKLEELKVIKDETLKRTKELEEQLQINTINLHRLDASIFTLEELLKPKKLKEEIKSEYL